MEKCSAREQLFCRYTADFGTKCHGARMGQKCPIQATGEGKGQPQNYKKQKTGPRVAREGRGEEGVDHREISWVKDNPTK